MSMPRLNRVTLVDRSYDQVFVSKSEDVFISPGLDSDEKLFDISVDETYPEIGCVNIEQDCNWFLASGVVPQSIPTCQLGLLDPVTPSNQPDNISVTFPGLVTYEVRPGKIKRSGFKCWGLANVGSVLPPPTRNTVIVGATPSGLQNVNTSNALGCLPGQRQVVFSFKLDDTDLIQGIYEEYGIIPISPGIDPRIQFVWTGTNFAVYTYGSPLATVAHTGSATDWHEVSIAINPILGQMTIQVDNATPTVLGYVLTNEPSLHVLLGSNEDQVYPGPGEYAMFRLFNSIRPYSTYHCEDLTGLEPNAVCITRFTEGAGSTSTNIVNNTVMWTLFGSASWGTDYFCPIPPILSNELIFNGTSQYVVLRNSAYTYGLTTFRIKTGFQLPSGTTGRRALYAENSGIGVIICLYYDGPSGTIGFYRNEGTGVDRFCMTPFTPDSLHHTLEVTHEPNGIGQFLVKLYLDGLLVNTAAFNNTLANATPIATELGRFTNPGTPDYWNGSIAYVQIHNNSPSAAQIFNEKCELPSISDTSLVAGWLFGDGIGSSAVGIGSSPSTATMPAGITWSNNYTCNI